MKTGPKLLPGAAILALLAAGTLPLQAKAQGAHAKITANQAKTAALARYKGVVTAPVKLENEEGHWQYSVMVRSGKTLREIMVDSHTGKIASVETTSKAEEAREAKADAAKMHTKHHK